MNLSNIMTFLAMAGVKYIIMWPYMVTIFINCLFFADASTSNLKLYDVEQTIALTLISMFGYQKKTDITFMLI